MAAQESNYPLEGGCDCGNIRYALRVPPIVVQCCHCRWCQRETGASFVLHAMIEEKNVQVLSGEPQWNQLPTASGIGQKVARCPSCLIPVWCVYLNNGDGAMRARTIKVGTLDKAGLLPPQYHIWTSEKQPWITLSDDIPQFDEFYDMEKCWPKERIERRRKMYEG